jgi:hypothetical protein
LEISDHTGSIFLKVIGDEGNKLIGITPYLFKELAEDEEQTLDFFKKNCQDKKFNLKIKASYNNQSITRKNVFLLVEV